MLRQNGYRFVIDSFNQYSEVAAGDEMTFVTNWSNQGVAPSYLRRTLTYRLRSASETVTFDSTEDIRTWLPGALQVADSFTVPASLAAGTYDIEIALLDRAGTAPDTDALAPLHLGVDGKCFADTTGGRGMRSVRRELHQLQRQARGGSGRGEGYRHDHRRQREAGIESRRPRGARASVPHRSRGTGGMPIGRPRAQPAAGRPAWATPAARR